jgi:hypothetical protein
VRHTQPLNAEESGNCPSCNKPLSKDRSKQLTWLANGFCALVIVSALTSVYMVRNPDVYRRLLPSVSAPPTSNIALHTPSVPYAPIAHNTNGVTATQFKSLKVGMNYKQVRKIMGSEGTRTGKTEIEGVPTSMYLWQNLNGSNVSVEMRSNKLALKTNFHITPK